MSLECVSRHTVYKAVLKEAAGNRVSHKDDDSVDSGNDVQSSIKPTSNEIMTANQPPAEKMPGDAALLSEKAKLIIFGEKDDSPAEKEKSKQSDVQASTKLIEMFPVILYIIQFLSDCYFVFDSKDIKALDIFISKYKDSRIEVLSQYASGLMDDYEAVKNSLVFSHISNGPLEGKNSRIKMIHRRSGGRAGLLLLNAYMALR